MILMKIKYKIFISITCLLLISILSGCVVKQDNINTNTKVCYNNLNNILSGCIEQYYYGNNTNTKLCYDNLNNKFNSTPMIQSVYTTNVNICNNIETLESYKFKLKEITQKDLIKGKISGSYLLISGSIYGTVEERMYLVVTYFDQRINGYKITKFDLEQIEINTIDKNESAYFKYKVVPISKYDWCNYCLQFDNTVPILYLPEGWSII